MRTVVAGAAAVLSLAVAAQAQPTREMVTPAKFLELSTGVARVTTYRCGGAPLGQGTGFLVGSRLVMTARHVLEGACRIRVLIDGERFTGSRVVPWISAPRRGKLEDVATIKLDRSAAGHVFAFRATAPPAGTNLAMMGYPLGNRISLNQGKIIRRFRFEGIPLIAVQILGAEGSSGAPLVDDGGRVVAILQLGLSEHEDVLGQRTAGVVVGIEFPRWWRGLASALCREYPSGGVPGCA